MNKYLAKKMEKVRVHEIKNSERFLATRMQWHKGNFKSIKNGGACAECAKNYIEECERKNKELNIEDFEKFYFKNCKSYDEFCKNATNFQNYLNKQFVPIDYETAYLYCWIRLIWDTFYGAVINEYKILRMISEVNGDSCVTRSATLEEDTKYKVDIVSTAKDTDFTVYYQIKPITFYRGCLNPRNKDILEDLEVIINSHEELMMINPGNELQWIFYDDEDEEKWYFYEADDMKEILKKGKGRW